MLTDLEKNMEGYQGSVKAVMREVKHNVLKGIHAPVSQIISVKDKYALAVETALGAAIQNIITDKDPYTIIVGNDVDYDAYMDEVETIDNRDYLRYRLIFAERMADNWAACFIDAFGIESLLK